MRWLGFLKRRSPRNISQERYELEKARVKKHTYNTVENCKGVIRRSRSESEGMKARDAD